MPSKPKVIVVGPEPIWNYMVSKKPEWDFLPCVPTIADLWTGLNDGSIDNDIQIMITIDSYFDPSGEDTSLEMLAATMSPYCLFLIFQYRPEWEDQISKRIESQAAGLGSGDPDGPFFIPKKNPHKNINDAVAFYIANSQNRTVADILAGRDPEVEEVQEADDTQYDPAAIEDEYSSVSPDDDDEDSQYLGQVVAATSSKGGSGKSTVAITLATYLAHASQNSVREGLEKKPLKIIVLDLDVRDGQIGFLTGSLKPTVLHMRSLGVNEKTLNETVIHSERLGVDLLLAPKRPRLSDDTPPQFYLELIQFLKKHYDYVILDTSVNYLDPLLEKVAYPIADLIVFVTDIVVNSVYSMTRWIQEVTKSKEQHGMGISAKKIGIVVNKSISNVNMSGEKIAKSALGIPVITVIPNNAKLIAHAANLQMMESILRHPDICVAIRRLARAIVGNNYNLSDTIFR